VDDVLLLRLVRGGYLEQYEHDIYRPDVRLRKGCPPDQDVTLVDGLPVTTVERTIADMAADGYDSGHVTDALRDAVRSRLLDTHGLAERLGAVFARVLPQHRPHLAQPLARQLAAAVT
jgi:phosphoglycolate phosphatase-like HAD superfamily hydrolase